MEPLLRYIKNVYILTQASPETWVYGGVLIEDQRIKEIISSEGPFDLPDMDSADENLDAEGMLLIPGQVNSHYHSYANLLKGTINNLPLELWSLFTVAYGHSLSDLDIHSAVLLGSAEMMRSGITGVMDHFPHLPRAEAALTAYEKSGMRVGFAPMLHDIPDHRAYPIELPEIVRSRLENSRPRSVAEMKSYFMDILRRWQGKNGRIQIMLGPNAPQRCSREMLKLCGELSIQEDLQIHMHLFETRLQRKMAQEMYGEVFSLLQQLKLLNDRLSVAHAVWLKDEEIALLAQNRVSVVHNPMSNLTLGSGQAPILKYLRNGIPVALGTDAANCGGPINLYEIMRLAAVLHRINEPDYLKWPQVNDVWQMGTEGGASILGMREQIGKIAPGYKADLVLLQKDGTVRNLGNSQLNQLVFHESGSSVDSVMINGQWTMRSRKILTFDEQSVIQKILERQEEFWAGSQGPLEFAQEQLMYWKEMYRQYNLK